MYHHLIFKSQIEKQIHCKNQHDNCWNELINQCGQDIYKYLCLLTCNNDFFGGLFCSTSAHIPAGSWFTRSNTNRNITTQNIVYFLLFLKEIYEEMYVIKCTFFVQTTFLCDPHALCMVCHFIWLASNRFKSPYLSHRGDQYSGWKSDGIEWLAVDFVDSEISHASMWLRNTKPWRLDCAGPNLNWRLSCPRNGHSNIHNSMQTIPLWFSSSLRELLAGARLNEPWWLIVSVLQIPGSLTLREPCRISMETDVKRLSSSSRVTSVLVSAHKERQRKGQWLRGHIVSAWVLDELVS